MAVNAWPTDIYIGTFDASIEFDVQMNIFRDGSIQTYGLPGARWTCVIGFEPDVEALMRPKVEAFVVDLEGGANRLQMHHQGRPYPNGSMRGSPTMQFSAVKGAKSATLANVNGTLKRGDVIGILGQNVMITADATPAGGNMPIAFKPALRNDASAGVAVVWNKPQILWIPRTNVAGPFGYRAGKARPGFSIEFVEVY